MDDASELTRFAENQLQEVILASDLEGEEDYRENGFTQLMMSELIEAGELDDAQVCFYQARGLKVNGYGINEETDCLDLFYTNFTQIVPPSTVLKSDLETGFQRLRNFLSKALAGEFSNIEESSPVFDMLYQIREWGPGLQQVRLFYLTDGLTTVESIEDQHAGSLTISHHVWDIRRIHRCLSSGEGQEPIEIDFCALNAGRPLSCLEVPAAPDYRTYLAVFPGALLAELYAKYGARLLERNVRAFLQARGKINKRIRQTILNEPEHFLAFNNGISATAAEVRLEPVASGGNGLAWAREFQIVNGGQTTASIYHAIRKDGAEVPQLFVQAKLSVVKAEILDTLVPLISRYSNSQNKVSEADFSATDPFHVKLEELSRTIWTPPAPGQQRQTHWFYERARGQFLDAQARESTPAKKKAFLSINPKQQRFTKTDLAKFENTYAQFPHLVSRGAEKNFTEFMLSLKEAGQVLPDEGYFRRLIAKAILFRRAEKIVNALAFGGYRAQIVTHSLSFLSHRTAMRLDLDRIWKEQDIAEPLTESIRLVAGLVHRVITVPPGGRNVTEWCKKEECWKRVRDLDIKLPETLSTCLVAAGFATTGGTPPDLVSGEARSDDMERIAKVPPDKWFELSAWAKQTGNLQPWQRGLAFSIGRLLGRGKELSRKQATQGVKILDEAARLGFKALP